MGQTRGAPPAGCGRTAATEEAVWHASVSRDTDLARALGSTRYFVLRAFRPATGIPPYGYLTQFRVERARRLLQADLPIAALAQRVGFADQSHLNRHFRRLVGVTPGVFARGARAA